MFFVVQISFACNCITDKEARKKAIIENKFILLQYSSSMHVDDKDNGVFKLKSLSSSENEIANNFVYLCVFNYNLSFNLYGKYKLNKEDVLLVLDINGEEVYRFKEFKDDKKIYSILKDFSNIRNDLNAVFKSYIANPTIDNMLNISQKYFDYSIILDHNYSKDFINIGVEYIKNAEKILFNKDENYNIQKQKLELFKLFKFAYNHNFDITFERIYIMNELNIYNENSNIYYFLKFLSAKAMQSDDLVKLEEKTKTIVGFDFFFKKTEILLKSKH